MDSLSPRDYVPQELPFFATPLFDHVLEDCQCQGKVCTKCKHIKCCGAFSRDKRAKDGRVYQCKKCKIEYKQTYQPSEQAIANRKAYMAVYSQTHREQKSAYNKAYHGTNSERFRDYRTSYAQSHREEQRARMAVWNESHTQYRQQYNHAYHQRNKERLNARSKQYYQDNADKFKGLAREYERIHAEETSTRKRMDRERNRERYQARDAAYYQANKHDRVKLWNKAIKARRRTRQTQAGGSYTALQWTQLKTQYNHTCLCCGRKEPEIKLTADHVIPVSKFGSSNIDNIQPLCGSCNSKKHNRVIDYRVNWEKVHG